MTDLEINMALAMAIGWKSLDVIPTNPAYTNCKQCWVWTGAKWKLFDYRDWRVAGPIAERYDCFPERYYVDKPKWRTVDQKGYFIYADTPQKAIALAVIGSAK